MRHRLRTRAYMLRGLLPMSRGEMASEIPEIFEAFGPQLNAFMSVAEFCLSMFVVIYSSLGDVRPQCACRI